MMAIVTSPSPERGMATDMSPYAGAFLLMGAALLFAAIRMICRKPK